MKPLNSIKLSKGFTLIELMIVIAIASILMTLAVPSFSLMINNSKVTSATNEFIGSLNLARSEALKRSNNVSLCMSANTAYSACLSPVPDGTSYTEKGWIVFSDCNANGVIDTAAAAAGCADGGVDQRLKVGESNDQVKMDTHNMDYVTFNLSGRVVGGGTPSFDVETNTSNTSVKKNQVTISRIGRVKSTKI